MKKIKLFPSLQAGLELVEENKARRLVIRDKKYCLARYRNQLYVIQDNCPHSAASLSTGSVNNNGEIVCPLHSYCYDLKTGREYQEKTEDASVYPLIIEDDGVYMKLD